MGGQDGRVEVERALHRGQTDNRLAARVPGAFSNRDASCIRCWLALATSAHGGRRWTAYISEGRCQAQVREPFAYCARTDDTKGRFCAVFEMLPSARCWPRGYSCGGF